MLRDYRPPLTDVHFWLIQALIVVLTGIPFAVEALHVLNWSAEKALILSLIFITLLLIPVMYAGMRFGPRGAVATALWSFILAIPHTVFTYVHPEQLGELTAELIQLATFGVIASLVAQRLSRETLARRTAEAAIEAVRLSEARRHADLREYASRMLQAQEEERKRLARDIHDDVIQRVSLLSRILGTLAPSGLNSPNGAAEDLKEASTLADGVATTLRSFATNLRPQVLDDLGLAPSLRRILIDVTERTHMQGHFEVKGKEQRLPPDVELRVFRIAQEALRNVERHSRATRVRLEVSFAPATLQVAVTDNGVGFYLPPGELRFSPLTQMGLMGMHERATLIDGKLEVASTPGKGTRVSLSVAIDGQQSATSTQT